MKKINLLLNLTAAWFGISIILALGEPAQGTTFGQWLIHELLCVASALIASEVFTMLRRERKYRLAEEKMNLSKTQMKELRALGNDLRLR